MRIAGIVLLLGLALLRGRAREASGAAEPEASPYLRQRVAVELEDECIIVGRLSVERLTFESLLLGKM